MSELTVLSGLLIKMFSNKNFSTFQKGLISAKETLDISGIYGILYDDFDVKDELRKKWKREYPEMKLFCVANRRKTLKMDSKLLFAKKMLLSKYTPPTYLCYNDIPENTSENALFFIKKDGSTGSRHVHISKYSDISANVSNISDINQYIYQESMLDPDLYDGKRYKIRVHVILHNKNVYLHKLTFATVSCEKFTIGGLKEKIFGGADDVTLKKMNVICQANSERFILYNEIKKYELIENSIIKALEDFKYHYLQEINSINSEEYVILGFDFVVDKKMDVHIIEINHRSNYSHPSEISDKTDVMCMRDLTILLLSGNTENTDLIKINDKLLNDDEIDVIM